MTSTQESYLGPLWTAGSLIFFTCANLLLRHVIPASARQTPTQAWKWRNIATSFLHSLITGIGALLCFYQTPKLAEDVINAYSVPAHFLMSLSTGYFIYDFFDMALNHRKRSSVELMIHHICVIACFGLTVWTKYYIGYGIVALLVEVNSVFLHLRQLFLIQGVPKNDSLYRLNSIMNVGTFLMFRIITLGWMTRWLVVHRDEVPFYTYTLGCVAMAVITVMNIVLFFRILHSDYNKKARSGASSSASVAKEGLENQINGLAKGSLKTE